MITLYVSPEGNDEWSGVRADADGSDGPLQTLEAARDRLRALRRHQHHEAVRVLLRGGRYSAKACLLLEAQDGGTAEAPVVYAAYPGERPVISGGRVLQGWQPGEINGKACWQLDLPDIGYANALFVNGERRYRSRWPKQGCFHFAGNDGQDLPTFSFHNGPERMEYAQGDLDDFVNASDIEITAYQHWIDMHQRVTRIDTAKRLVHFETKATMEMRDEGGAFVRYLAENVKEACTEPGEWYWDRSTGILSYIPMPGEDKATADVVLPQTESLLRLEGEAGHPVEHVRFENIDFQHAQWVLPEGFVGDVQACYRFPAVVTMHHAQHCVLYGGSVSRSSQYGVEVLEGCHRNRVVGVAIYDMGAGGVKVNHECPSQVEGTPWFLDPTKHTDVPPSQTTVADCVIHDCGKLYPSAIGIWVGDAGCNRIVHNHIYNCNYTGISCGWTWGYAANRTYDNRIEYNHIHHINDQEILSDNGGIYTLGVQPGTVLRGNHIHDISCYHYGGWGIYPDEGSSEILVEQNVIHHTRDATFSTHYGRDVWVRNNLFALSASKHINLGRPQNHRSAVFEKNVVVWPAGSINSHGVTAWDRDHNLVRNNLWFPMNGSKLVFNDIALKRLQANGQFIGDRQTDPLLADPSSGWLALRSDSPALVEMGFEPLDPGKAGLRYRDALPSRFEEWQTVCEEPRAVVKTRLSLKQMPGGAGQAGVLQIDVVNRGEASAKGSINLLAFDAALEGDAAVSVDLAPGGAMNIEKPFVAQADRIRFETEVTGVGLMPTALPVRLPAAMEFSLASIDKLSDLEAMAQQLTTEPAHELRFLGGSSASVRVVRAGDDLLLRLDVADARLTPNHSAFWEGSGAELFFCPLENRPRGWLWNDDIRQLFVVPPADGKAGRLLLNKRDANGVCEIVDADAPFRFEMTDKGYVFMASLPFALCNIPVDDPAFLCEIAVKAHPTADDALEPYTLFGASTPSTMIEGMGRVNF